MCDVVPMHAGHLLLGRPWQFDRKVIHDGFRNRYSFNKDRKKVTFVPLTPKQVYDDQVKLKEEVDSYEGIRESGSERSQGKHGEITERKKGGRERE